jgi:phosphoglycolate phosphatase
MSFLAVFDVDGTLVDSQRHIVAAMDHAHDSAGRARLPRERVLDIVGLSLPEAFACLHPGLDETSRAALVAAYKDAFGTVRATLGELSAPLYAGVAAGLARLEDAGLLLGAATGKSRRGLNATFEAHDLHRHFVTTQTADDHPSKPHPAMLWKTLEETGSDAGAAAMIGDTEYDMAMARAAGFTAIGVTWGYHAPDRLRQGGAQHLVDDFAALEVLLSGLSG